MQEARYDGLAPLDDAPTGWKCRVCGVPMTGPDDDHDCEGDDTGSDDDNGSAKRELIGPFSQEPAFGSPEAVALARRQIAADLQARLREKCGDTYADELLADAAARSQPTAAVAQAAETIRTQALAVRSQDDLDSTTRVMEWYLKNALAGLRRQRDKLADALETLRCQFPRSYDPSDARRQYGLADPLSGIELASFDALLRKAGRLGAFQKTRDQKAGAYVRAEERGEVDGLWDLEGRYLEALDVLEEALAMIHKCASVKDIGADDFPAESVTGRGLAALRKAGRS